MNKEETKNRIPFVVALVLCAVVLVAAVMILPRFGKERDISEANAEDADDGMFSDEKWKEGVVTYEGKSYLYKTGIRTYLIMGVDNDNPVEPAKDGISGGQSDAMFLLVVDRDEGKIKVIAINRNTITPVDVYDTDGEYLGRMDLQICLQHGYGDGGKLSCMRATEAVERLFYNIPISGYVAMNMGGIPAMNDAIGGVTLTALETVSMDEITLEEGETYTLSGREAYVYLRKRDIEVPESANMRLERQKQYVSLYIKKLLSESSKAASVYNAVSDYCVASVDVSKLVSEVDDLTFNESDILSLTGTTDTSGEHEAFYADDEALMELILSVFYEEVAE